MRATRPRSLQSELVTLISERRRPRRNARRLRQDHADSCVLSSDEEELARDRDVYVTTHTPRSARTDGAAGIRYHGPLSAAGVGRASTLCFLWFWEHWARLSDQHVLDCDGVDVDKPKA